MGKKISNNSKNNTPLKAFLHDVWQDSIPLILALIAGLIYAVLEKPANREKIKDTWELSKNYITQPFKTQDSD